MNIKKLSILLLCCIISISVIFSGCTEANTANDNTADLDTTIDNQNTNTKTETNETNETNEKTDEYITIKDMLNRDVKIKKDINNVVLIDFTGTYIKIMKIWGIDDKVVGVDNSQMKNEFLKVVCPRINSIPDVGSSKELNYETIASTHPDVVIIRAFTPSKDREEQYQKIVDKLNSMDIPVVVLLHPTSYKEPNINTMWTEIDILGKVFNKETNAKKLINYLDGNVQLVKERTKDIPDNEKPEVMLFATPDYMLGAQTIQSYFLEDIVRGKNIVKEGSWIKTSPEEILKLNPDVMIILGHGGYVSADDIYSGKIKGLNWKLLENVKAIKDKKVGSVGTTEWRATIEFPIGLLREAKTLYPDKFSDIDPDEEEIKLYKEIYGLSDDKVKEAVIAQRYYGNPH